MRKAVIWVAVFALALTALGTSSLAEAAQAGMAVISCPEENFSTLADFDFNTEYVEGDGLYIELTEELMPYVLVTVDTGDTRVTDAEYYMNEVLAPDFIEAYKPNGALSSVVHGDGQINGRPTPVLELQYHNTQGAQITLFALLDVYDDYTVYYRARYYRQEDREATLAALETVAKYLKPDAHYYSGTNALSSGGADAIDVGGAGDAPGETTGVSRPSRPSRSAGTPEVETAPVPAAQQDVEVPQMQSAGGAQALSFTVTPLEQGGMVVGRCTAPEGYNVQCQATCSVTEQSAGNPWLLRVAAQSPDGMTNLIYTSARDYVADGNGQTQDGVFSFDYYTPMLHYMNAAEYSDYYVQSVISDIQSISLVEDNAYPELDGMLRQKEAEMLQTYRTMLGNSGLSADKVEMSLASRRYYIETGNGLKVYYCVATASQGAWFTASLPGPYVDITNSYILWNTPYVYTMLCPAALWDERGAAFDAFVENTTASDQFLAANQKLSNQLWDIITGRGTTEANRYSEDVMRQETASGDDYNDERFTDYLFDQNDYTLSSGDHVKVSTAYDYVFEGTDGNVYYSNSLSDQPGGSTQLYPN